MTFYSDRKKICDLNERWQKHWDAYWKFRQKFIEKYGIKNFPRRAW